MGLNSWSIFGRSLIGDAFIETGTQYGSMLRKAMQQSFKALSSVDCSMAHINRFVEEEHNRWDSRVHVFLEDSRKVLFRMCNPALATTFWLDAHFCGDNLNEEIDGCECPLLDELYSIRAVPWRHRPVILIDDAKNFMHPWKYAMNPGCNEAHWPNMRQIVDLLPDHSITIWDNILYCLPREWTNG